MMVSMHKLSPHPQGPCLLSNFVPYFLPVTWNIAILEAPPLSISFDDVNAKAEDVPDNGRLDVCGIRGGHRRLSHGKAGPDGSPQ